MSEMRNLQRRVMNMVARGVIAESDDEPGMQRVQISLLHEEGKTAVERFQNYGFSGHAPGESEVLVLFVGGGRDHGVVVAVDDRGSRFTDLVEGEVAIYSDEGDSIVLRRDNTIELTTKKLIIKAEDEVTIETKEATVVAEEKITIEAPDIVLKGNVEIDGNLTMADDGGEASLAIKGNIALEGDLNATGSVNAPDGHVGPQPQSDESR